MKRGAILTFVTQFKLLSDEGALTDHQFNKRGIDRPPQGWQRCGVCSNGEPIALGFNPMRDNRTRV